nr:DUF1629 domain-containing protein [Ruegeria sp. HKCCD7255]
MTDDIEISEYPDYVYFGYRDIARKKKENLPDIFTGFLSLIYISGEMHDLLTQFELGHTRFKEVELREYDQKTPFPGRRWFFMHIRENRKTFVPEKSVSIHPVGTKGKAWSAHPEGDNKLAIDATNACDLDLWIDRSIRNRVFFSDRLKIAIKDSGLSARWLGFRPCEIVKRGGA